MKKSLFIFIGALVFVSCQENKKPSNEIESVSIVSDQLSEAELKKNIEEFERQEVARILEKQNSTTTLKFDKLLHDFGTVGSQSDNLCEFKVTNTGDKPLIIEKVSASCGCTTPRKPEKPIMPGMSDVIEVGFHPKPTQLDEIIKKVTVIANTEPKESLIEIRAFVSRPE